jgi:transketolase
VFVLVSDAECNEGQVWEAAMFAAHQALSGLVAIVDLNGLQALGHTREILAVDMAALWSSFGWDTVAVDGHDLDALQRALRAAPRDGAPRAIVARTLLGKGVSFMEDRLEWHYRNLTPELAQRALAELAAGE